MLTVCQCGICFEEIEKFGAPAFDVYQTVFELNLRHQMALKVCTSGLEYKNVLEVIKFLEAKGFLVSTEIDKENIAVKLCGVTCLKNDDEETVFEVCSNRKDHD